MGGGRTGGRQANWRADWRLADVQSGWRLDGWTDAGGGWAGWLTGGQAKPAADVGGRWQLVDGGWADVDGTGGHWRRCGGRTGGQADALSRRTGANRRRQADRQADNGQTGGLRLLGAGGTVEHSRTLVFYCVPQSVFYSVPLGSIQFC